MRHAWVALALVSMGNALMATEYFVAPTGRDTDPGTNAAPFATLSHAGGVLQPGDTLTVRGGVYRETLKLARSGQPGRPIVIRAAAGETPVISGADAVTGWQAGADGTWTAPLSWPLDAQNQVFDGDQALGEVCWPKRTGDLLHPTWATMTAGTANTVTDPNLPGDAARWKGALLFVPSGYSWVCWSRTVTGYDAATHTLTFDPPLTDAFYTPKAGNTYLLIGAPGESLAAGEWRLEQPGQRLRLRLADGVSPAGRAVEAKRRVWAIDLAGRQHVQVVGLSFRAAGLRTDGASADLLLDGLTGTWLGHSLRADAEGAVVIAGQRQTVRGCHFAWSSAAVMRVSGRDHRIENNLIEHGNYGGKWQGVVALSGRRITFAHNTVRHAGRDVLSVGGLTESRVVYNELSDSGWLTSDLGMTYGHNTDFGGTEFAYNLVHDNHAPHTQMGIYFDHCSHNAIVHHNVIWGIKGDPVRFNNPCSYMLAYHNTCFATGAIGTFDHSKRGDMFGSRYQNNLINQAIHLPEHVVVTPNLVSADPGYLDPAKALFTLKAPVTTPPAVLLPGISVGDEPYLGAYPPGRVPWRAGHDFAHPPAPQPAWQPPKMAGTNRLLNTGFELGTIEYWQKTGDGEATCSKGNGWGNTTVGQGRNEPTGTSQFELRLTGTAGVEQVATELTPGREYLLSGWLRAEPGGKAALAVRGTGLAELAAECEAPDWTRQTIRFVAPADGQVTVAIRKVGAGAGAVFADIIGLAWDPVG